MMPSMRSGCLLSALVATAGLMTWGAARAEDRPAAVRWPPDATAVIQRLAIQHDGRLKPFDSFARETIWRIAGISRIGREDPLTTILAIIAEPDAWQAQPIIAVPFLPLRQALGMDRHASHVSYNDLVATRKLMRMLPAIVAKQQREEKLTMLEQETMDAFDRFATFSGLIEQRLPMLPPPPGAGATANRVWVSIAEPSGYPDTQQAAIRNGWNQLLAALRRHDAAAVGPSARTLSDALRQANPAAYPASWRLSLEVFYNRFGPFRVARLIYWLAALILLLALAGRPPFLRAGMAAFALGAACHLGGISMRVVLGGRPPVSNFFETLLWLPFVAVVLALVFERIYRAGSFSLAASVLAAIALTLADLVPLDSSISPVVAVLRSNLWLTIHVLTIVASYGALALATVLAHLYGWAYLARPQRSKSDQLRANLASLDLFLYRVLQVGVVLLAAGIMLGAVWANASWGRYWGWDPKETWALITLLWFLAVLHGRFAGWLHGVGVAVATIAGFLLLLMTYYGVIFYLVGLHSYAGGHAKPIPLLLIGYLIAELAFLGLVGFTALRRQ